MPRWQKVTAAQIAEPNVQTEAVSRGVALVGRLAAQASLAGSEATGSEFAVSELSGGCHGLLDLQENEKGRF